MRKREPLVVQGPRCPLVVRGLAGVIAVERAVTTVASAAIAGTVRGGDKGGDDV